MTRIAYSALALKTSAEPWHRVLGLLLALFLLTIAAVAQQEIDPDHFDGTTVQAAPHTPVRRAKRVAVDSAKNRKAGRGSRSAKTSRNPRGRGKPKRRAKQPL
jgi:hypothetical protein